MRRLVLDIPDDDVEEFLKYVRDFPSKEIEIDGGFILDQRVMDLLDKSSVVSLEACISREQLKKNLQDAV